MDGGDGRDGDGDDPGLGGLRVLVAEDQALVAIDLEATLLGFGCVVLTMSPSTAGALEVLRAERPDAALLDVTLSDGSSAPVAEALAAAGVPFAVLTGHDPGAIRNPALCGVPYLAKPYHHDGLRATVAGLAAAAAR